MPCGRRAPWPAWKDRSDAPAGAGASDRSLPCPARGPDGQGRRGRRGESAGGSCAPIKQRSACGRRGRAHTPSRAAVSSPVSSVPRGGTDSGGERASSGSRCGEWTRRGECAARPGRRLGGGSSHGSGSRRNATRPAPVRGAGRERGRGRRNVNAAAAGVPRRAHGEPCSQAPWRAGRGRCRSRGRRASPPGCSGAA
jgi:hypothetical protein